LKIPSRPPFKFGVMSGYNSAAVLIWRSKPYEPREVNVDLFSRLKLWEIFGKIINSRLGVKFIDVTRPIYEWGSKFVAVGKSKEPPPFTPFEGSLSQARVGLVTTTGVYMDGQEPFDVDAALGDSTYRVIPSDVDVASLRIAHTHYPHARAEKDINVIFPVERLRELVEEGVVASLAGDFISYGFDLHVKELVDPQIGTAHEVAQILKDDEVDVVLITPG
jgi:D-proline reductase (dithiol) PrdB